MSVPTFARSRVVDAIGFNALFLPGRQPEFMVYTIKGGQRLLAGSVLGRITATGKLVLAEAAAGDGSQTPMAVLPYNLNTYDADGNAKDMTSQVVVKGHLNETALVFGTGLTIASTRDTLRAAGILTRAPGYSG